VPQGTFFFIVAVLPPQSVEEKDLFVHRPVMNLPLGTFFGQDRLILFAEAPFFFIRNIHEVPRSNEAQ